MKLEGDDIAFLLGKHGSTKRKVERASKCELIMEDSGVLRIRGTADRIPTAKEFVLLILSQRKGSVEFDFSKPRNDLSVVEVPRDCVGYVNGKQGTALRNLEAEWGTLMVFAHDSSQDGPRDRKGKYEKLAIFGEADARCGAELKVRSSIEYKVPGEFLGGDGRPREPFTKYDGINGDFGIDTIVFKDDEYSYCLGKNGQTRKKLGKAAGCILEYIGNTAFIAGPEDRRNHCMDYLRWLIQQRVGKVEINPDGRTDCTVIEVHSDYIGFITGKHGKTLRSIEERTDTFCCTDERGKNGLETILIFGCTREVRERARREIMRYVDEKKNEDARRDRGGSRRSRSRSRSRSPYGRGGRGGGRYDDRYDSRDRRDRDHGRDRGDRDRDYGRGDRDRGYDRDRDYGRSSGRRDEDRGRSHRSRSRSRSPRRDRRD